jgi:hypothetical protein
VLGGDSIDEHVGLRRDDGRVDEAKEEEAADEGAEGKVGRFWIFPLRPHAIDKHLVRTPTSRRHSNHLQRGKNEEGETHSRQAPNLLADPSDPIRHRLQRLDDRQQEAIRDLHQHRQSRLDDRLDILVGGGDFRGNASREIFGHDASVFFDLIDHLLVHLRHHIHDAQGMRDV